LIGEKPEDVFGGDWKNEIKKWEEEGWMQQFIEEFGIHFKGSKGELQFVIAFIEDLLERQRIKMLEKIKLKKIKNNYLNSDGKIVLEKKSYNQAIDDLERFFKKTLKTK